MQQIVLLKNNRIVLPGLGKTLSLYTDVLSYGHIKSRKKRLICMLFYLFADALSGILNSKIVVASVMFDQQTSHLAGYIPWNQMHYSYIIMVGITTGYFWPQKPQRVRIG